MPGTGGTALLLSRLSVSVLWLQFPGAFVSSLVVVRPNFFHDVFKIGLVTGWNKQILM